MENFGKFALLAIIMLSLAACAAGTPHSQVTAQHGDLAEFLLGLWHGFIAPVTLIGEVINKLSPAVLPWSFGFYESRDTGIAYDIGFYLTVIGGPSALFRSVSR